MLSDRPQYLSDYEIGDLARQSVSWDVNRWREQFKGSPYSSFVDNVHRTFGDEISRGQLLDFSESLETTDLPTLFLGSMIWGRPKDQGIMGLIIHFREAIESANAVQKLEAIREALIGSEIGAVGAYRRMKPGGDCHLPNIGPSFGTKILYFFGYRNVRSGLLPLIWDRRVATSLWDEGCRFWRTYSEWDEDAYELYLRLAHRWASALNLKKEDTHLVEYALFKSAESKPKPRHSEWKRQREEILREMRAEWNEY